MVDTILKSTTRHIRIFTARVEKENLIPDSTQLTLDIDPDNEFIWSEENIKIVRARFRDLVDNHSGADLTDYTLRRIGTELEGTIFTLLQKGELSYNPDARVLNYSMGVPRIPELP
uniref:NAD(P)H-quinone oxidoreductase subunit M n=1 Tax=Paulinella longichromatophora TaxID=1708747 RepID=A0A2H4ZP60_9EUKA|nr:hypothetical protein PLO_311 [Paulinella longichromatophora]